jgi:biofilm PGA synthesis N-glycosyltransferase PgaC
MFLDSRYERGLGRYYYWMIWYPLAFWILSVFTTIVAIPKVVLRGNRRARWKSPDRGLQP